MATEFTSSLLFSSDTDAQILQNLHTLNKSVEG